jgi:DNA end-binding protein Ku
LAAVKPDGLFLVLELMHFAQEILSPEQLTAEPAKELTAQELKMAETLIETMSTAWHPEKYKDQYRDALLEIIEQKAKDQEVTERSLAPRPPTKVVDPLKVLQESINRTRAKKPRRIRGSGGKSTATLVKAKRRSAA